MYIITIDDEFVDVKANYAGPPSLIIDAREATHRVSRAAAKQGWLGRGIPELAFSNHSFTL
jgi:hypothetical protein